MFCVPDTRTVPYLHKVPLKISVIGVALTSRSASVSDAVQLCNTHLLLQHTLVLLLMQSAAMRQMCAAWKPAAMNSKRFTSIPPAPE